MSITTFTYSFAAEKYNKNEATKDELMRIRIVILRDIEMSARLRYPNVRVVFLCFSRLIGLLQHTFYMLPVLISYVKDAATKRLPPQSDLRRNLLSK